MSPNNHAIDHAVYVKDLVFVFKFPRIPVVM